MLRSGCEATGRPGGQEPMDTQDTRKCVTAAVMVTACRIVAPTCEDQEVCHTHVPDGRMVPEHVVGLLHDSKEISTMILLGCRGGRSPPCTPQNQCGEPLACRGSVAALDRGQ